MNFDPIRLELYKNMLASVAEEMGVTLCRAAFSPNIKERRDFSCAVFDAEGGMVAQAAHIPVHLGSMPLSVLSAIEYTNMSPGDMVILNDPFRGGTHLPDITLVAPVFVESTSPAFFIANRAGVRFEHQVELARLGERADGFCIGAHDTGSIMFVELGKRAARQFDL